MGSKGKTSERVETMLFNNYGLTRGEKEKGSEKRQQHQKKNVTTLRINRVYVMRACIVNLRVLFLSRGKRRKTLDSGPYTYPSSTRAD